MKAESHFLLENSSYQAPPWAAPILLADWHPLRNNPRTDIPSPFSAHPASGFWKEDRPLTDCGTLCESSPHPMGLFSAPSSLFPAPHSPKYLPGLPVTSIAYLPSMPRACAFQTWASVCLRGPFCQEHLVPPPGKSMPILQSPNLLSLPLKKPSSIFPQSPLSPACSVPGHLGEDFGPLLRHCVPPVSPDPF